MSALLVGYARCSTDQQDLTAQRDALSGLGVEVDRIYVDHGLTGTNRERPGLREALAACRAGDTLVVTKLDRLARSLPDARAIADELTTRQISLSLGGSVYDPSDAVGRLLFNVLAMVAEFESDLIRLRTVEGMKGTGVVFQDTIDTYYDLVTKRLPEHNEDLDELRRLRILIDGAAHQGAPHELLLQIFTKEVIGPIFFEIIQRKGNEGFGEGNFKALFESIELDQIRRGVLKADA